MKTALIEINDLLLSTGMSQTEIDHLMARFLEEEAFDYVDTMNEMQELVERKAKENTVIH